MKVAAIQMNSGADPARNLELAARLLSDAAHDGCALSVLPENFALMGKTDKGSFSEFEVFGGFFGSHIGFHGWGPPLGPFKVRIG